MNRNLFKTLLLPFFITLLLLGIGVFFSKNVLAQQTTPTPTLTAQQQYENDNNCHYRYTNSGYLCVADYAPTLTPTPATASTPVGSQGSATPPTTTPTTTQNTGIFSDPNTYCATHDCHQNDDYITGLVFVDTNGNGQFDSSAQYCSDTNENKVCDAGEKTFSSYFSCLWSGEGNCIQSTATAEKGYANATITIDGTTTTTGSTGKFNAYVPTASTHTVALTLPTGYVMTNVDGNTATRTVNGSASKVNFAIQPAPTDTAPAICDPNGDGKQDSTDMTILENEWFGEASTKTADCNNDGVVNGLDFQILKDEINGISTQSLLY